MDHHGTTSQLAAAQVHKSQPPMLISQTSVGYQSQTKYHHPQADPTKQQAPLPLGVGGLPQARAMFVGPENSIRHPIYCCYGPGPNIPLHWHDGGRGWVTKYFYDHVPRDPKVQEPGQFRCQFVLPDGQLCNHQVTEDDFCKGNCCWVSGGGAHNRMGEHVRTAHGQEPPAKRAWASELCDTEGCLEALCCLPCQGSRQMMALLGWEDTFDWGWCLFFSVYWMFVACFTRPTMVARNNIDESCCTTFWTLVFCSWCSVAQTYRELAASGVWTGSDCDSLRPANYACMDGVCSPPADKLTMV